MRHQHSPRYKAASVLMLAAMAMGVASSAVAAHRSPARHVARVARIQGKRLFVQGADAARLARGMAVWVSQRAAGGAAGLPIVEAKVVFVHGGEAMIELPADAPAVPADAVVEPRFVAEARLYGQRFPTEKEAAAAASAGSLPRRCVASKTACGPRT